MIAAHGPLNAQQTLAVPCGGPYAFSVVVVPCKGPVWPVRPPVALRGGGTMRSAWSLLVRNALQIVVYIAWPHTDISLWQLARYSLDLSQNSAQNGDH